MTPPQVLERKWEPPTFQMHSSMTEVVYRMCTAAMVNSRVWAWMIAAGDQTCSILHQITNFNVLGASRTHGMEYSRLQKN